MAGSSLAEISGNLRGRSEDRPSYYTLIPPCKRIRRHHPLLPNWRFLVDVRTVSRINNSSVNYPIIDTDSIRFKKLLSTLPRRSSTRETRDPNRSPINADSSQRKPSPCEEERRRVPLRRSLSIIRLQIIPPSDRINDPNDRQCSMLDFRKIGLSDADNEARGTRLIRQTRRLIGKDRYLLLDRGISRRWCLKSDSNAWKLNIHAIFQLFRF